MKVDVQRRLREVLSKEFVIFVRKKVIKKLDVTRKRLHKQNLIKEEREEEN